MTQTQNPKRIIYRQGDVILEQIEYDLKDLELYARFVSDKLEISSENGNKHVMSGVKVYNYHSRQLVVVEKPTPITHQQHPTILVTPGIYMLRFVRDWFLRESRPYD
jgi:hypothetical protein